MIILKTDKEIEIMRAGGEKLAALLKAIVAQVKPGVTTGRLEQLAGSLIKKAGAKPSFKGYKSAADKKAFPTALCLSINDEVVHAPALPSRRLNSGDIVGIDVGIEYPSKDGYFTDMAITLAVGKANKTAKKLIKVTKKSLELAIKEVKPGNSLNTVGKAIEKYVLSQGFSVVRDLVGHGVGTEVHEEPQIPNYAVELNEKIILKPGMVLALEPMVNLGKSQIKVADDGFTVKTADGNLSAHFEHTVAVTTKGHLVLTA